MFIWQNCSDFLIKFYINYVVCKLTQTAVDFLLMSRFYINYVVCKYKKAPAGTGGEKKFYINYVVCKFIANTL